MDDTAVIPIEQLLKHRAWVRTLARRLVIDESLVDDVEQQTWLAALERPPRPGSARAWLGAVVRNVASKLRRKEARLAERHQRKPHREASAPTGDVVAEAELHHQVVEAVLALDEPYRTTLLLCYFEGLPPREVATRMEAPVETVRVRRRRAVERIRKDLDRRHGQRRAWQLAFVPLTGIDPASLAGQAGAGSAAVTSSVGTGVLLMSTQTKIVLAAVAALLVAGLVVWSPWTDAEPEPPRILADGDGDREGTEPLDPELATRDGAAAPGPAKPDVAPPAPAPDGAWIEVVRRTASGTERPRSMRATWVDANGTRHDATGTDGVLAVPAAVEGAATLWLATVEDEGFYRFDARAYPAGKTALQLEPPARLELRFRTENGLLKRAEVERRYEVAGHGLVARWVSEGRFTNVDPIRSRVDARLNRMWTIQADGRWQEDAFRVTNTPTGGTWRLLVSRAGGTPWLLDLPKLVSGETATIDVPLTGVPKVQSVQLLDRETGAALPGARVTPYYEHGDDEAFFPGVTRRADEFGSIPIPYGDSQLGVRAPHWRVETDTNLGMLSPVEFRDHPEVFEFFVLRKTTIRGTAWRRDGQPAVGALVVSGSKGKMAMTEVDEHGRFVLADVLVRSGRMNEPHGDYRANVVLIEDLESMAVRMQKVQAGPGEVVEIQIGEPRSPEGLTVLSGRITAGGMPLPDQFVIVRGESDDTKGGFVKTDADGRYRHEGLTPGKFEFRVFLGNPQVADDFCIIPWGDASPRNVEVAGAETTLDFDLPAGRVRVRVQDDDGKPLQGVAVLARPHEESAGASRFEGFRYSMGWAALSNPDGVAELYGLARGVPLKVFGGQRELGWKFEREGVQAGTDDDTIELVITRKLK